MIIWSAFVLPPNWCELIEDIAEQVDRTGSKLLAEELTNEDRKVLEYMIDKAIDDFRRGTWMSPELEQKLV
jgi:hypothetical protein